MIDQFVHTSDSYLNISLLSGYLLSHLPSWFALTQVRVLVVKIGNLLLLTVQYKIEGLGGRTYMSLFNSVTP
jgi:hypothetical protein